MKIDEIWNNSSVQSLSSTQYRPEFPPDLTESTEEVAETDMYIPSMGEDTDMPIPSGTYNQYGMMNGDMMPPPPPPTGEAPVGEMPPIDGTEGSGEAAMQSGTESSSSSESDETTTSVVTVNGVTYLQTITYENGIPTITRTPVTSDEVSEV